MIIGIAAVDKKNAIGKGGKLPWHYSSDMKFFRETTSGHAVVMGRKTYLSLAIKPGSQIGRYRLVELIGEMAGSGYRVPPSLVRRIDGQTIQLTPLLYATLRAIDGQRSAATRQTWSTSKRACTSASASSGAIGRSEMSVTSATFSRAVRLGMRL